MQLYELYMDARMFPRPLKDPGLRYGGDYSGLFAEILGRFQGTEPENDADSPVPDNAPDKTDGGEQKSPAEQGFRSGENSNAEKSPETSPENSISDLYMIKLYSRRFTELLTGTSSSNSSNDDVRGPDEKSASEVREQDPAPAPEAQENTAADPEAHQDNNPVSAPEPESSSPEPSPDSDSSEDNPAFQQVAAFLSGTLEMTREDRGREAVFTGVCRKGAFIELLAFSRDTGEPLLIAQLYPRLSKVLRWPLGNQHSVCSVVYSLYAESSGIAKFSEITDFAAARNRSCEEELLRKADLSLLPQLSAGSEARLSYLNRFIAVPEVTSRDHKAFQKAKARLEKENEKKSLKGNAGDSVWDPASGTPRRARRGFRFLWPLMLGIALGMVLGALFYTGVIPWPLF
ncbi:hypothetical protein [Succinimonas sp.]|uniref:hypothetical protein n=1 Tax=Succinimonas sp. TaxID=1936151 RepID=UPI0038658902